MRFVSVDQPTAPATGPAARVNLVQVAYCEGRTWLVSPAERTLYYLDSLGPADTAHAVMEGMQALMDHDLRPKLRLVHSVDTEPDLAVS